MTSPVDADTDDDPQVRRAVEAVLGHAAVPASTIESLQHRTLLALVTLQRAGTAILMHTEWRGGVRCVASVTGVQHDVLRDPGDPYAPVNMSVLPGYEQRLATSLFSDPPAPVIVTPDLLTMIRGTVRARMTHTVALPIPSAGTDDCLLLLSLSESPSRHRLQTIHERLQPVLRTYLTERRAMLLRTAPGSVLPLPPDLLSEGVMWIDAHGALRTINTPGAHMLRVTPAEAIGGPVDRWFPPELLEMISSTSAVHDTIGMTSTESGGTVIDARRVGLTRGDGTLLVADVTLHLAGGAARGLIAVINDQTAMVSAEERERFSAERFQTFADPAPVGILQADNQFECTYVNQRWVEIHGIARDQAGGMGWISSIAAGEAVEVLSALREAMLRGEDFFTEMRVPRPGEIPAIVQMSARPLISRADEFEGFIATTLDVSQQRLAEEHLRNLAERDQLTGLLNRSAIEQRMAPGAVEGDEVAGLLYIDLDGFKQINDTYGHDIGDELLRIVAQRLRSAIRADDVVARMGGDEFVVWLGGMRDATTAEDVAESIRKRLTAPIQVGGHLLHTSTSIGVALMADRDVPHDLLRRADAAMYQAKAAGKNAIEFYTPSLHRQLDRRTQLVGDAHLAVRDGDFDHEYQVVAAVADDRVIGVECLLRWEHPVHGAIGPAEFVPLLEGAGLISDVGSRTLGVACQQMASWRADDVVGPEVKVSVNISVQQLRRQGCLEMIRDALDAASLPPANLMLEVTESTLLSALEHGNNVLEELHALGIGIAIDDFGTGFSSLAYLKSFPIDVLKIDRGFVADMPHSEADMQIVRAVCALGASLGMQVIAEGVSDPETLVLLRDLGCNSYQGYLLGRPQAAADLTSFLRQRTAGRATSAEEA